MTARPQDAELLPDLDEWLRGCPDPSKVSPEWMVKKPSRLLWRCRDALASAQAREDELRADRDSWAQQASDRAADWHAEHQRAERLEEALRYALNQNDHDMVLTGDEIRDAAGSAEGVS